VPKWQRLASRELTIDLANVLARRIKTLREFVAREFAALREKLDKVDGHPN
jgi:hypothetical protein